MNTKNITKTLSILALCVPVYLMGSVQVYGSELLTPPSTPPATTCGLARFDVRKGSCRGTKAVNAYYTCVKNGEIIKTGFVGTNRCESVSTLRKAAERACKIACSN